MKLMIEPKTDGTKEAVVVNDDYQLSVADQAARCYLLGLPPEYAGKRHSEILNAWRAGVFPDPLSAAGGPSSDANAPYAVQVYVAHAAGLTRATLRFATIDHMMEIINHLESLIAKGTQSYFNVDDVGSVRVIDVKSIRLIEGFHIPSWLASEKAVQDMQAQLTPVRT